MAGFEGVRGALMGGILAGWVLSTGLLPLARTAQAELWVGFYATSTATAQATPSQPPPLDDGGCISQILAAQLTYGIPDNLLLAIGLQEAGRKGAQGLTVWPWTANANGEGRYFADKATLLKWVRDKQNTGIRSIDVGCMQINQKWHGQAFRTLEEAVSPTANVDYAARYLRSLFDETGDWWQAAGRYHSSTQDKKTAYLAKLEKNLAIATSSPERFAALGRSVNTAQDAHQATPQPASHRKPQVMWGYDSANDTGATRLRYSIYSTTPLEPVLPDFH